MKKRIKVQRWHGSFFNWPEELAALLGKIPDAKLAKKIGLSTAVVRHERRFRGIPPFRKIAPIIDWTPEMIALLGKDSDERVAASLGLSNSTVFQKRWLLGIPACGRRGSRPREWTEAEIALLGTQPDQEVAEKIGVSLSTTKLRRRSLGIPAYCPVIPSPEWTEEMLALLGTVTDSAIAQRMGTSSTTVNKKRSSLGIPPLTMVRKVVPNEELIQILELPDREVRRRTGLGRNTVRSLRKRLDIPNPATPPPDRWSPEVIARLGVVPDMTIAKELRMRRVAVSDMRRQRGIPMYQRTLWTPEEEALLGTAPDSVVAQRIGRGADTVRWRRNKLDIAPFHSYRHPGVKLDRRAGGRLQWPVDLAALLGKISDVKLAQKADISRTSVASERRRRGIPPCHPVKQVKPPSAQVLEFSNAEVQRRTGLSFRTIDRFRKELGVPNPAPLVKDRWSPEVVARLGTVPDKVIAEELGIQKGSVCSKRLRLGIPASWLKKVP